jgi:hypothetical protein
MHLSVWLSEGPSYWTERKDPHLIDPFSSASEVDLYIGWIVCRWAGPIDQLFDRLFDFWCFVWLFPDRQNFCSSCRLICWLIVCRFLDLRVVWCSSVRCYFSLLRWSVAELLYLWPINRQVVLSVGWSLLKQIGLRSSGMLRSVCRYLFTDVSGQHIGPIFESPAVQEDCLTLDAKMDCPVTLVTNY